MGLTKEQIIEIQESAKFNYAKQLRQVEDRKALQEAIESRIDEERSESSKKGK